MRSNHRGHRSTRYGRRPPRPFAGIVKLILIIIGLMIFLPPAVPAIGSALNGCGVLGCGLFLLLAMPGITKAIDTNSD